MNSKELSFWNSEYPFKDFLLISTKNEITAENIFNLNIKLKEINLNIVKINNYKNINNYVISNDKLISFDENYILFSGMNVYNKKFYFGENDLDKNINREFINCTGMFTAISVDNDSIIATQDDFGCGSLFYAEYNNGIFISNRYHLLLLTLSWMGFKGELDIAKAMYWIYFTNYNSSVYTYNSHNNMDIKGVYNLPINKYIYINEDGWTFKDKESVNNAFNGISDKSYEEEVDLGVQDVTNAVEAIANNNNFEKYIVEISGGFDSRVTLSAVGNLKDNMKNLQAYVDNTSVQGDLEIGNGLRKLLGIKLYEETVESIYPMTIDEQLRISRSYLMGSNHSLSLIGRSNKNQDIKSIILSGGMGEFYRSKYIGRWYGKILAKDNSSAKAFSKNLVDSSNKYIKEINYKNLLYELFENTFENSLIGESLEEKLINHQLFFHLRHHFGMSAHTIYNNKPRYHPLMSKHLLVASKMLSIEERKSERFMLEITQKINPILAWSPYENKKIDTRNILNSIALSHDEYKNFNIQLDFNTEDWKLQNQMNIEYINMLRAKHKNIINKDFYDQWRNLNDYLMKDIVEGYEKLSEYIGFYSNEFLQYINQEQLDNKEIRVLYSKIISLIDQIKIFS